MADLRTLLQASLEGRYQVERQLGRGGMAMVYLARDLRHDRRVAIKVLLPELAAGISAERFAREIRVAANLSHPNILPLYDSGLLQLPMAEGQRSRIGGEASDFERTPLAVPYYVMPYVEGESLAQRLHRESQLPIEEALEIAEQVAAALAAAHEQGVIHRDIKPENILLSGGRAMVADFGIARPVSAEETARLTDTGLIVGTPEYMSPEQIAGDPRLDSRSDIYSLACVVYEMLVGEPPFTGPTPQSILARHTLERVHSMRNVRDTIPESVELAVARGMAKAPVDRFRTAADFARALRAPAPPPTREYPALAPGRPRARWMLAAALTVLVLVAVAIGYRLRDRPPRPLALDPARVAVLPFRITGTDDSASRLLARSASDLLAQRLPGGGGPAAVDPGTVSGALNRLPAPDRAALTPTIASRVAGMVGAGQVLLGDLWTGDGRVVLNATLLDARNQQPITRVENVRGPPDSLSSLLDRFTTELLVRAAGEADRLPELLGHPLPALRAYLGGTLAYAGGRFSEAADRYMAALQADPSLAAATLGLASLSTLEKVDAWRDSAWRRRSELMPADRAYLAALVGPRYPRESSVAERLAAWEKVVAADPNHWERWYQLGELLYHSGPLLGVPGIHERAGAAFRRTLDLAPRFVPALGHLLDLAASDTDTAQVRALGTRYLALDSVGDLADYYRWRIAVALGDSLALARLRGRFSDLSVATLDRIIEMSQLDGVALSDAVRAAQALRSGSGLSGDTRVAFMKLQEIALNRGRPKEAADLSRQQTSEISIRPRDRFTSVADALYWGADTVQAARLVQQSAAIADAPARPGEPDSSDAYFDVCATGLWRAARGEMATLPRLITRLRRVAHPFDQFQTGYIGLCAEVLETQLASSLRRPDLPVLVNRLDSLMRTGPPSITWMLVGSNLTVARLREAQGDYPAALAATRRRIYVTDLGEIRILVGLSSFLREEGRLAVLAGDTTAAVSAYSHYLALRDDPEPGVKPEVEKVRAAYLALEKGLGEKD